MKMTLVTDDQIPGPIHPTTATRTKRGCTFVLLLWTQARLLALYMFSGLVFRASSCLVLSSRILFSPYVCFILLSRRR